MSGKSELLRSCLGWLPTGDGIGLRIEVKRNNVVGCRYGDDNLRMWLNQVVGTCVSSIWDYIMWLVCLRYDLTGLEVLVVGKIKS